MEPIIIPIEEGPSMTTTDGEVVIVFLAKGESLPDPLPVPA